MEKYKYISGKVLTIGGRAIAPDGLTKLDKRTLDLAIKSKVIKKVKSKKDESTEE